MIRVCAAPPPPARVAGVLPGNGEPTCEQVPQLTLVPRQSVDGATWPGLVSGNRLQRRQSNGRGDQRQHHRRPTTGSLCGTSDGPESDSPIRISGYARVSGRLGPDAYRRIPVGGLPDESDRYRPRPASGRDPGVAATRVGQVQSIQHLLSGPVCVMHDSARRPGPAPTMSRARDPLKTEEGAGAERPRGEAGGGLPPWTVRGTPVGAQPAVELTRPGAPQQPSPW